MDELEKYDEDINADKRTFADVAQLTHNHFTAETGVKMSIRAEVCDHTFEYDETSIAPTVKVALLDRMMYDGLVE